MEKKHLIHTAYLRSKEYEICLKDNITGRSEILPVIRISIPKEERDKSTITVIGYGGVNASVIEDMFQLKIASASGDQEIKFHINELMNIVKSLLTLNLERMYDKEKNKNQ